MKKSLDVESLSLMSVIRQKGTSSSHFLHNPTLAFYTNPNLHCKAANSRAYSLLNPLLKFLFCGHYSIYKEFFYYVRFLDNLFK